ncbi:MAG: flavodoxin family protein [Methanomicrobiales archaeon]|nr:flavodoxin family protein [Methanomicrobiales archaeon]NYT20437.1 flavodoxin family protein [Methanomicrobiales archaeon]
MKVIGLNASPRGNESRTLRLVNAVLDGARDEGAKTELVDIYDLRIEYCTACGSCYASGDCTLMDDFPDLFERLMDADGIVLGAPNYIDSIPAPLKAVFDRMADAIHCRMFTGKFGCSVCTAGGSNHGPVVEYMNHALSSLGAITVGGVGVGVGRDPGALSGAEKDAVALGRTLVQAIRGEHRYPDQEEALRQRREYFRQLILYNKENWPHEYEWYVRMGWITE